MNTVKGNQDATTRTESNETGKKYRESFTIDEVLLKYQEALAERDQLKAQLADAIPSDVYMIIKTERDADESRLRKQVKTLLAACKETVTRTRLIRGKTQSDDQYLGLVQRLCKTAIASVEEKP